MMREGVGLSNDDDIKSALHVSCTYLIQALLGHENSATPRLTPSGWSRG